MMKNFKIIIFCQLLFTIVESAKELHKKELDRLEYLLERLEKDVSGIKDNEQFSRKEKIVEALNKLNKVHAKSTTDADNSESDDLDGDSSTQSSSTRQYNESSPAETTTTTATNSTQPASESTEPPYITPTPSPSQSSNVSTVPASGFGTGDSSEVELVKPLKSLLDALRKKIASHCAAVDDLCGFHHGKMECCPGLRCSSDWSGTCLVDCVAAGKSCRQNWFCCDGRQCTKVVTDDGSKEYVCK